jgi:hypothetical protein
MINWKGFRRKRSWLDFKVLPRHWHGETEKNHERHQDCRSPGRDGHTDVTVEQWADIIASARYSSLRIKPDIVS